MTERLSKEDSELIQKHDKLKGLLSSEAWQTVRDDLLRSLAKQNYISRIDLTGETSPDDFMLRIKAVQLATDLVVEWLDELYRFVEVVGENKQAFNRVQEEEMIVRFTDRNSA
jgi:hypothetical protein